MTDPTEVLKQKIAAAQASKGEEKVDSAKPSMMAALAATDDTEDKKEESKVTDNMFESLAPSSKKIRMQKAKTPNPRRKYHAKSTSFASLPNDCKPFVLGICGGPSSGMSSVAKNIKEDLERAGISSTIINQIDFYKPLRGKVNKQRSRAGSLVEEENKEEILKEIEEINQQVDFDDPSQIDFELLIGAIEQLNQRKPFNLPVYDKFYKIRLQSEQKVMPTDVIIVEGALIFCNEKLREMFDLSVFIDTDDDVRLSRRVLKNAQAPDDQKIKLETLL